MKPINGRLTILMLVILSALSVIATAVLRRQTSTKTAATAAETAISEYSEFGRDAVEKITATQDSILVELRALSAQRSSDGTDEKR